MAELQNMNYEKISKGNPLLKGVGLIGFQTFCDSFEIRERDALQELSNYNIPIYCFAENWETYYVDDYRTIERENDGGFVLNDVFSKGIFTRHSGPLIPLQSKRTYNQLISQGKSFEETVFVAEPSGHSCHFLDLPGIDLLTKDIYISKIQAEGMRQRWAKHLTTTTITTSSPTSTPSTIATTHTTPIPATHAILPPEKPSEFCNPKYKDTKVSSRLEDFIKFKGTRWTEETAIRTRSMIGLFLEIMGDPTLGQIDRDFVRNYIQKLKRVPHHRDIAKKQHKTDDINKLIELCDSSIQKMSNASISKHIEKLSQYCRWLSNEGLLKQNPAEEILSKPKKKLRDQDKRDVFARTELEKIFSVEWFKSGTVEKNSRGGFSYYRPYHFWLPLLALYTGGRINELSQLYLKDIKASEKSNTYYLDFNLEGQGKLDKDSSDISEPTDDKTLKTTNAERIVPIHRDLIELGLIEYSEELKKAGYARLFPELKRDRIKGYGKPATSFFNERFFGQKLGIARNGKKTFHSFRHMFISKLWELDIPEHIIAQLVGHARGLTESSKHYRKDSEADRLSPYIDQIEWDIPPIKNFNSKDGVIAVRSALLRKKANERQR